MDSMKEERSASPEGLLPALELEVPPGFDRDEWEELTEGYACEDDEISTIIAQRGEGGSRKGRPTKMRVPYKGELSSSSRAIAQRDRAALLNAEDKELDLAKASDRSAKSNLKKKIRSNENYRKLDATAQGEFLSSRLEVLAEKRYNDKKSAEWLQTMLDVAHKKWERIHQEIDLRQHARVLEKASGVAKDPSAPENAPRALQRLYNPGGVLDTIMRRTYLEGLVKLESGGFESQESKQEWQDWVNSLTPKELAMVSDTAWVKHELSPLPSIGDEAVDAHKSHISGYDSDDCEEEVSDDSELEEYYGEMENEYETEEQYQQVLAEAEEEKTDFEGFSDAEE